MILTYTIPETALDGTVKLTFTKTSGADPEATHTVTMTSELSQSFTLSGTSLSGTAQVESVDAGDDNLDDATVYTVTIEYQDQYGNAPASDSNTLFTYDTSAPTISTVVTIDSDGDGQIDQVQVTMSEDILWNQLNFTWSNNRPK